MTDVHSWPEPAPEPPAERGEDPRTHLLPSVERLEAMRPDDRAKLAHLTRDWTGPLVEEFRRRLEELRDR